MSRSNPRKWHSVRLTALCLILLISFWQGGTAKAQDKEDKSFSNDFTFVWLSDTQYYSEKYPRIFKDITSWIAKHQQEQHISYVIHTGDIVNRWDSRKQWKRANAGMKILEQAKVPYGILAGNHDVHFKDADYSAFDKWFGAERFIYSPYFEGEYRNNRGHYDIITKNGQRMIVVYMGFGIGEPEIEWINQVLAAYPHHKAILAVHDYMKASGERSLTGEKLYQEIVLKNPNLFAVLCGHNYNARLLTDEVDDNRDGKPDRKVYQILADYQKAKKGGLGYIRLLQFDTKHHLLRVQTYSPYLKKFNYYKPDRYPGKDEFTLNL